MDKRETSAGSGSPHRRLLTLAWPIIGLNVLNVLTLAVDTAMLGRAPGAEVALTGLGFATQILFLLMVAMMGLTVGTVAFVARAHGAGQPERVRHLLAQSTWLTVLLSLGVTVSGLLGGGALLRLLGAGPESEAAGMAYLSIMLLGVVFNYLNLLYAAVLRGVGETRLPFVVALGMNLLNAGLNYCLILGNLGFPALGLQGAALGTLIAQACAVLLMGGLLQREFVPGARLTLRLEGGLDRGLARDLVRVGAPAALDMVVFNVGFLTIIGLLGRIDEVAVAAHGVGLRVQALAFVPGMSIGQATGALVGNALGAGDVAEARRVARAAIQLCALIMTVLGGVFILGAAPMLALFDIPAGTALAGYATTWIQLLGLGMPMVCVYIALGGVFQGSGATRISLYINSLATLLIQMPLSWLLGFPLGLSAFGVWLAFPIALAAKSLLGALAYRQGTWARAGSRA